MSAPSSPTQLRVQIEHTRKELGDTLEELAAKTDIKALAQRKANDAMRAGRRNARTLAAAGGAVLAVAVTALVMRQRYQARRRDPLVSLVRGSWRRRY
ncbi:MAG TPA: DUF3618 domain-containing protein [Streptomyces sp.]|nr:DUF3618 domain-containing protein [Streptomyces sp.]